MNKVFQSLAIWCCAIALWLTTPAFSQMTCFDPALVDTNAVCPAVYDPVCGCNGITYSNACVAEKFAGLTSWTPGECPLSGPCPEYCTTDFEYTLNGTALHAKFDFGDVDPPFFFYAIWSLDDGAATGTGLDFVHLFNGPGIHTLCATYPTGDFTPETCTVCKAVEVKALCVNLEQIDPDQICITKYVPVCGCDGVTYGNSCEAYYYEGITSWVPGECGSVCNNLFPDFIHYADASALDIQFEDESVFQGGTVSSWFWSFGNGVTSFEENPKVTYSAPGTYEVCMTLSGKFADGSQCGVTFCRNIEVGNKPCFEPWLIDSLVFCPAVYDPVCGCDGVTYPNDCIAKYHFGIASWMPGPCQSDCFNPSWVDFNTACIEIYDPVCGCDGNDYDNWCQAVYYGGIKSWVKGKCCNDQVCHAKFEVGYLTANTVVLKNNSVNAHAISVDFGDGSPIYQGTVFDTLWHSYQFPGIYQICLGINDFTGECTDLVCKVVQLTTSTSELGNGLLELALWPNPASERVQVEVTEARPSLASMFDVYGKKVWEKRVFSEQFEVETAGLPNGVYLLQVMTDRGRGIRRLAVSH